VGEGDADVALLARLKELYVVRGCGIALTVENGHGGGANGTVNRAIRLSMQRDFDHIVLLYDADTAAQLTIERKRWLSRPTCTAIVPAPCLESLLLQILEHPAPNNTGAAKVAWSRLAGNQPYSIDTYRRLFSGGVIEQARKRMDDLDNLVRRLRGEWPA
jgi:hypothetical protein